MSKYEFTLLQGYLFPNFPIISPESTQIKKHFTSQKITCYKECVCTYKWNRNQFKFLNIETHYCFNRQLLNSRLNITEQSKQYQNIIRDICERTEVREDSILLPQINATSSHVIVQFKVALSLEMLSDIQLVNLYHQQIIGCECDRIKQAIHDYAFRSSDENALKNFIHKKQSIISQLCYQYHRQVIVPNAVVDHPEIKQLKQAAYQAIINIMQLIETQYFDYININIEIPHRSSILNGHIDPVKLQKVKETLLKLPLEKSLLKAVYNPIVKLSALTHVDKITYREFLYYVFFINEIYNDILEQADSFNETKLINILNAMNYNHLQMFYYNIAIIKNELNKESNTSKRINLLYHYLKEYNQMQVSTNLIFNPNLPSIKQQVIAWIEEEINYIQRIKNCEEEELLPIKDSVKKITVNLSVAQLAYFVKLLAEVKVMDGSNQNELLRFLANHCQTTKTEVISFKSLSSKFYNVEQSTKQSVRDVIIKLLNLANKKD